MVFARFTTQGEVDEVLKQVHLLPNPERLKSILVRVKDRLRAARERGEAGYSCTVAPWEGEEGEGGRARAAVARPASLSCQVFCLPKALHSPPRPLPRSCTSES